MSFTEKMLKIAAKVYAADMSAPSITVAWLTDKDIWYASLCRYPDGVNKLIVTKAYSRIGVDHCVLILASGWGSMKKAHASVIKLADFRAVKEAVLEVWRES